MDLLKTAITLLEQDGILPDHFQSHKLSGAYTGFWEAHLKPDWLIVWKIFPEEYELWLTRTGTHSDLF